MAQYKRTTFRDLPIGAIFCTTPPRNTDDPYEWLKVSTRTARIGGNGRVFYFCMHEPAYVADVRPRPNKEN